MKKVLLFLILITVLLAGCSSNGPDESTPIESGADEASAQENETPAEPTPSASAKLTTASPSPTEAQSEAPQPDDTTDQTPSEETVEKVRSSNICITTKLYQQGPRGKLTFSRARSLGSGILFMVSDGYYYALTNWHVIEYEGYHSARYVVTDYAGRYAFGEVVLHDKSKDLAVIRFKKKDDLPLMDITNRLDSKLTANETVIAVGNPGGEKNVVTFGHYKGMADIGVVSFDVINHDAQINHGSSGGALCDINGKLIGINTWGNEQDDHDNFAVPLEVVGKFLDNL